MLLTGTFQRSLDEKQRVAIPKRIRTLLESEPSASLYLAPGVHGSMALYTEAAFEKLADRLAAASPTGGEVLAFSRLFFANAQAVEMDAQGRVRIPLDLAKLAKLEQEIVLVGVRDHLEIWDISRWQAYCEERQPHYDEIAEQAFAPVPKSS